MSAQANQSNDTEPTSSSQILFIPSPGAGKPLLLFTGGGGGGGEDGGGHGGGYGATVLPGVLVLGNIPPSSKKKILLHRPLRSQGLKRATKTPPQSHSLIEKNNPLVLKVTVTTLRMKVRTVSWQK